ncbi:MAG: sulfatase-like hydrolase/transferase [Pseudomonadota bacterium]
MTDRPSYILFITDQQRYDHLGCNGHPVLKTPNIDAIAEGGVNYDRFYVASPVCMPNRSSLMTCRMPSSHGVRSLGLPLEHDNVTFVELLRAAGYDTALIGKSHLQNVSGRPVGIAPPLYRDGYAAPPQDLAQAVRSDLEAEEFQYESKPYWAKDDPKVPLPFYGFDHYNSVQRHGTMNGGDYEEWLKKVAPQVLPLRGRADQLPHDYTVPQAIRTKIPEEYYSSTYVAEQAAEWLAARKGNPKPFFLMVSWPDPHHPFNPPGKYWDMYKPEEMPVPAAYGVDDWDPPAYVKIAERDRARDTSLGQMAGYSIAVSQREAQEAAALTCGMIAMIDDGVGKVRAAAQDAGLAKNTVQIFTSDHGDHLGDHRLLFKGAEQYDTLTHVPFIWADPKGEHGVRSDDLAQTLDIGSTILEHAKVEPAIGMQGQVMAVAGGAGRQAAHIQYETQRTQEAFGERPRVHSIVKDRYRLSMYLGKCPNELFDLRADPGEMVNLWNSASHAAIKAELIESLAEMEIAVADRVPLPTQEA